MAVFGTLMQGQMNKYYTSKYYEFELNNNGKSISFATISRTDFEGYTVFEPHKQLMNMTGYYYGYKTDVPCGTGGFMQEEEVVAKCEAGIYLNSSYSQEKACFALDEENVLTKMNCDKPTEPESGGGGWDDLRRRELQMGGAYLYQLKNEEKVLEQLLSYFGELPVYKALDDDDGLSGVYLSGYSNSILSKNYLYVYNDDTSYLADMKFNIVRETVTVSGNNQFPSYTKVTISGYNDDSKVKIISDFFADQIGLTVGTYTYQEFKAKVEESTLNIVFPSIDTLFWVKNGNTAYTYYQQYGTVDEFYTYELMTNFNANNEIYKTLNGEYEYTGIGEGNGIYNEEYGQFMLIADDYYINRMGGFFAPFSYYDSVPVKRSEENAYTRYDFTMTRDTSVAGILFNTEYELENYCAGIYSKAGFYTFDQLKSCSDYDDKIGVYLEEPFIESPLCVLIRKKDNMPLMNYGCDLSNFEEVSADVFHIYTLERIEETKRTGLSPTSYTSFPIPEDSGLMYNVTGENSMSYTTFTSENIVDINKEANNVYATVQTKIVERHNYDYMTVFKVKKIDYNETGLIFYNVTGFTSCCANVISELENNVFYSVAYLNETCGDCQTLFNRNFYIGQDQCSAIVTKSEIKADLVQCTDPTAQDGGVYDIKTTYIIERENYKMIHGSYPDGNPTYPVPNKTILYREETTDAYSRNYVLHDTKIKTEVNITLDTLLGSDISFLMVYDSVKQELTNSDTNYKYSVYKVNEMDSETSGFIMTDTLLTSVQVFYKCPDNLTVGFVSVKELEDSCTDGLGQMQVLLEEYSLSNKVYTIALKNGGDKTAYELNGNLMFSDDSVSYTISKDTDAGDDGGKDDGTSNDGNVILPSMILLLLLSVLIL